MIHQLTVLVSVTDDELITKDVPLTIDAAGADRKPCVPPGVLQVRNIVLPVATAVVDTVTVPATRVAVPMLAFDPVAILSLLPAVVNSTLPATDSFSAGAFVPMPTRLSSRTTSAAVEVVPPLFVTISEYVEDVAPSPNTCTFAALNVVSVPIYKSPARRFETAAPIGWKRNVSVSPPALEGRYSIPK